MKLIEMTVAAVMSTAVVIGVGSLSGCASSETSRSTGAYVDDAGITGKVKTDLIADPVTKAHEIHVDTYRGHVQLNGFVDTAEQKSRAQEIASRVPGVVAVQNNLAVKPEPAGANKPANPDVHVQ